MSMPVFPCPSCGVKGSPHTRTFSSAPAPRFGSYVECETCSMRGPQVFAPTFADASALARDAWRNLPRVPHSAEGWAGVVMPCEMHGHMVTLVVHAMNCPKVIAEYHDRAKAMLPYVTQPLYMEAEE